MSRVSTWDPRGEDQESPTACTDNEDIAAPLNDLLDEFEDDDSLDDIDALYEVFTSWAESNGRPLYPHQDELLMQILDGKHVIAAAPTGSGKSMIALAVHFVSMAQGGRSYYTAPLKALASEKFFNLIALFGAKNVGMITGDSSLNADAPTVCCAAEILANQALHDGPSLDADMVIMDEFHFYGDLQRGWVWQLPLLELSKPQFIAVSATLGGTGTFEKAWEERTEREIGLADDAKHPVPLEFEYVVDRLEGTVERLLKEGRRPVYIVHFTQKDTVTTVQSLDKRKFIDKERREKIAVELRSVSFGRDFGQTLKSLLSQGIGVHHAGMLLRYRRLVERLAQQGLLSIACGTDALGVGVNVPIRTVLITSLVKFDGKRMRHLSAREPHQIAGRVDHASFDTISFVRVLAPEHEIEAVREHARLTAAQEAARDARDLKKAKKKVQKKRKGPADGTISWTKGTYERLLSESPKCLRSQFVFTRSMVLDVLAGARKAQRDPDEHLVFLTRHNDDPPSEVNPHLRRLGEIYSSMRVVEVVEHVSTEQAARDGHPCLHAAGDLPDEFALNQPLSPFTLVAMDLLDPRSPDFALDVVSVIKSVLGDPRPLILAQQSAVKGTAVAAMKAEGMEYEERMEASEEVSWPRSLEELSSGAFTSYVKANPWVGALELSPKSVVCEMVENAMTFTELVPRYDLGCSEGVILRYLSDAYRAMRQIIPNSAMTQEVQAITEWLHALIRAVDSSLLDEWEVLAEGREMTPDSQTVGTELVFGANEDGSVAFSVNLRALHTIVRKALFHHVEFMSRDAVETSAREDSGSAWDEARWDDAPVRYWTEYDWIGIDQAARSASMCVINKEPNTADLAAAGDEEVAEHATPGRSWLATQALVDPKSDGDWRITALVDLDESDRRGGLVLRFLDVEPR